MYIIGKRFANGSHPSIFTFNQYPHVHATFAAAQTESARLVRIHPGWEFCIFELKQGVKVELPPLKVTPYSS